MSNFPPDENQIQRVHNFQELISTQYHGEVNAVCWNRELIGDFSELVNKMETNDNLVEVSQKDLLRLELSPQGQLARTVIINDLNLLKAQGTSPVLNLIKYYDRDESYPLFPTDVYSFHVDRSPIPTDTFLCTYYGAASDILPNKQAVQKVLIPEIRKELQKLHDGAPEDFENFLSDYFFDLHYQAQPDANIINLGNGHLWKLAVDHPASQVLPCLHRAPIENEGQTRLMLIC